MSEPMSVQRIHTGSGSHIEPPLDQSWSDIEKLRWHLAVALHDAGMPGDLFTIREDNSRLVRTVYALEWRVGGMSPMSYGSMWTFINGLSVGFEFAAKRAAMTAAPTGPDPRTDAAVGK